MKREDIRRLLDRIAFMRRPCDLDLVVFFVRHPRSLLTSEQIAAFLGYALKDIAESLEVMLTAGLLQQAQHSAHAARMYVFAAGGPDHEWLPSLLRLASTRAGRLALKKELAGSARQGTSGPVVQMAPPSGSP